MLKVGLAELDRDAREDALMVFVRIEEAVDVAEGDDVIVTSGDLLKVDSFELEGVELEDRDARKEKEIEEDAVDDRETLEEEVEVLEAVLEEVCVVVEVGLCVPLCTVAVCVLEEVDDFETGAPFVALEVEVELRDLGAVAVIVDVFFGDILVVEDEVDVIVFRGV